MRGAEERMVASVTPFLMFQGQAEAALDLYRGLFSDAEVLDLQRYGPGESGPEGGLKLASLVLAGQRIMIFDSPPIHAFGFTPAFSLFVECETEAEISRLAEALAEGGGVLMPLGAYGFGRLFTWLSDRFGVSWQLRLS